MRRIFALLLGAAITVGGYAEMATLSSAINAFFHKSEIIASEYYGVLSQETWDETTAYSVDKAALLTKPEGEAFVILNFTDMHFADYDIRAFMAFGAEATMRRLVKKIKPDLITVTGDIVCSDSTVFSIARFTDLMESFGVPWAPVFGNHDDEGNCDKNYLADIMLKSPHCLMQKGDPEMGVGNYVVNLAQTDSLGNSKIIHSLIFMDSHKGNVNAKQLRWYEWAARGISEKCGEPIESSVLFHIPTAQYQYAYDAAWDSEKGCWREGFDASGELHEEICCERDENGEPVDGGLFDVIKAVGTSKNIICGHEHINNFSILWQGVRLTYTLKVGKGSGYRRGFNGGTKITVSADGMTLEHQYSI